VDPEGTLPRQIRTTQIFASANGWVWAVISLR
jgi:hypothetical protein